VLVLAVLALHGPGTARAAHFGTNKGGDTGEIPELPAFRRAGSGDSATPGIQTQFIAQHGVVAIGMVDELLNELNRAFCDQTLSRVYKCANYEDARRRLWQGLTDGLQRRPIHFELLFLELHGTL
jgi:hypothetical protein